MRSAIFLLAGTAIAAPIAQAPAGGAAPPAGGAVPPAGGAAPGGFDIGSILSGLGLGGAGGGDLGALLGGLGSLFGGAGGADTTTPVIIDGYKAVAAAVQAYDTAISAIPVSGDATAAIKDALAKSKPVEDALKSATTKIAAAPLADLFSSINLASPGAEVTSIMEKASDGLVSKKEAIEKAGQKAATLAAAKDLKTAVVEFTKAINAKLPQLAVMAAEVESARAVAATDKIITAFT